jgi:hypothetical protein
VVRGYTLGQTAEEHEDALLYFSFCNAVQDRLDELTIFIVGAE